MTTSKRKRGNDDADKEVRMRTLLLCASVLMLVSAAAAQTTQPCGPILPVLRTPEYAGADEVPDTVLNPELGQVVILPSRPLEAGEDRSQASGGAIDRVTPEMRRLPEGYIVARRSAQIEKRGRWYEARLSPGEDLPQAPEMRVLPNSRLDMLEALLGAGASGRDFIITGRVTEFQGNNFLLLESIREAGRVRVAPNRLGRQARAGQASAPQAATQPAGREPTAEEVLRELMQNQPRSSLVIPQSATTQPEAVVANAGNQWLEETLLVDRTARLLRDDESSGGQGMRTGPEWWMLAFDNPSPTAREQPIRVLPSQLLENAIALTAGGTKPVVLIVSGETTLYQQTPYLLLRKVLVRRDLGNFR